MRSATEKTTNKENEVKIVKLLVLLFGMFVFAGCASGTLTLYNKGAQKSYRVLDCEMTPSGSVSYTDMKGNHVTVSEPFTSALYENKFNAVGYEPCFTCGAK